MVDEENLKGECDMLKLNEKKKTKNTYEITALLKDHHLLLKSAIPALKDERISMSRKRGKLTRFVDQLKMHSVAEEKAFYERLINERWMHFEILECIAEHALVDTLLRDIEVMILQNEWNDYLSVKARLLAKLVEEHVNREEKEIFREVREKLGLGEREDMGREYINYCNEYADRRRPLEQLTA